MRTAISRRRLNARARSRLPTFAQAMSSTIDATPRSHAATFVSADGDGPRSSSTEPTTARGFATSIGVVRGASATCAA